jgi:hypothetical protein
MVHLHRKIWVVVELSHFKLLTTLKRVFIVLEIIVIKNGAKCKPHAKQNHAPVMFLSDFMFMSIQKLMQHVQHITIATPWIFGLRLRRPSLHETRRMSPGL